MSSASTTLRGLLTRTVNRKWRQMLGNPMCRFFDWHLANQYDDEGELKPLDSNPEAEEHLKKWSEGQTGSRLIPVDGLTAQASRGLMRSCVSSKRRVGSTTSVATRSHGQSAAHEASLTTELPDAWALLHLLGTRRGYDTLRSVARVADRRQRSSRATSSTGTRCVRSIDRIDAAGHERRELDVAQREPVLPSGPAALLRMA